MVNNKFRAKTTLDTARLDRLGIPRQGDWVYGYLVGNWMVGGVVESSEEYINLEWWVLTQEDTQGQFTGVQDIRGVDIYQGDIVEYETVYEWDDNKTKRGQVVFEHGQFTLPGVIVDLSLCTIVGNKHDDKQ